MANKAPRHLLVCYDISDPRRLQRVHACMKRWGAALQYSVFYCYLTDKRRRELEAQLRRLINERRDDIRIYGLKSPEQIQFFGHTPVYAQMLVGGNNVPPDNGD